MNTNIVVQDPDIRELVPRIMDIISQRLQSLYMQVADTDASNVALKRIFALNKRAMELKGARVG